MKVYYSRTVDTNDGINGSALQTFFENSGLMYNLELLRYHPQPVYSFRDLDSADMMIIGYSEDRYDDGGYTIGKGVYSEIQRADQMNIPMFLLNLSNPDIPYIEQVGFHDVSIIDEKDYTNHALIDLYYTPTELSKIEKRMCPYSYYGKTKIQDYLKIYNVDLSSLESKPLSQGPTVKYDPVTFEQIETSPSLLLLRRK